MKHTKSPLDEKQIETLRRLQGSEAPYRFALRLGVGRATYLAALARAELHQGTRFILAQKIQEMTGNVAQVEGCAA